MLMVILTQFLTIADAHLLICAEYRAEQLSKTSQKDQ